MYIVHVLCSPRLYYTSSERELSPGVAGVVGDQLLNNPVERGLPSVFCLDGASPDGASPDGASPGGCRRVGRGLLGGVGGGRVGGGEGGGGGGWLLSSLALREGSCHGDWGLGTTHQGKHYIHVHVQCTVHIIQHTYMYIHVYSVNM